ncbi:uncharacterized protein LOC100213080 isoform X1 [Hydra vulgaris]|uniref:uncharacterized protein LOC100213080 isoform X1 n=1 Tax=Hydra vulgaris TaxID=6087 RepID=UPI0002B425EA|nr:uncharacterized protein LOC100213080 isoform X1 [Hydra vulgaris]
MTLGDRNKVVNFYPTVYSTEYDRSFNNQTNTHSRNENIEAPQGILKNNKEKITKVPLKDNLKHPVDSNTPKKHRKHHLRHHHKTKSSLPKTPDLSYGKSSSHKSSHEQKDSKTQNLNILLTAGIPSAKFTYSPYIQKKRVVPHQGDCILLGDNMAFDGYLKQDDSLHRYMRTDLVNDAYQPEPCLQKKRITLYKNNHNILCTYTTKELSSPVVLPTYSKNVLAEPFFQKGRKKFLSSYKNEEDKKNISDSCLNLYLEGIEDLSTSKTKEIMSQYHAHKVNCFPGQYLTTYNHDYSPKLKKLSPVLAADLMLRENKKSSDKDDKLSSIKNSAKRNEFLYSPKEKCNKSLETADQPYMAENYDDDFIEYYRRILEDRYYSYHPFLLHKINQERENASINLSKSCKDEDKNPDNKVNLTTENQEVVDHKNTTVSNGSDSSSSKQSLFKKKTKDSVCSCSSYDSRYSLNYDPSLYSDSA